MGNNYEMDKWEAFYKSAESNIVGYKRPADYAERVKRVLSGELKRAPMRLAKEHKYNEDN